MIRKICKFLVEQEHKIQSMNDKPALKKIGEIGVAVFNSTVVVIRSGFNFAQSSYSSLSKQFSSEYKKAKDEYNAQVLEKPLFKDKEMMKEQTSFQENPPAVQQNVEPKQQPPTEQSKADEQSKNLDNSKIVKVKYETSFAETTRAPVQENQTKMETPVGKNAKQDN